MLPSLHRQDGFYCLSRREHTSFLLPTFIPPPAETKGISWRFFWDMPVGTQARAHLSAGPCYGSAGPQGL